MGNSDRLIDKCSYQLILEFDSAAYEGRGEREYPELEPLVKTSRSENEPCGGEKEGTEVSSYLPSFNHRISQHHRQLPRQ